MSFAGASKIKLSKLARNWLLEDAPSFDFGGQIVGTKWVSANLLGKSAGILAGRPFVDSIFQELGCIVHWNLNDGEAIKPMTIVAVVEGRACDVLLGERPALNLLARSSGIATKANRIAHKAKSCGFQGKIAGTRKTTPGFRLVEKYALQVGGCDTHRYDLSSMIMIKDNHVDICGSIKEAVRQAKSLGGFTTKVEVECRSEADAMEALEAGADIVMLDNASPMNTSYWSASIKQRFPNAILEVSGGIDEMNMEAYMENGYIDIISMGGLTQDQIHVDFSLKINS